MTDKQMIENPALEIRISNWYDVNTDKLNSAKDIADLLTCLEMKVSDTSKNFEKVKKFLIIPEPLKTLEEIQEEFEKKIDDLTERTKRNFYASNLTAENNYNRVFDKITDRFEFAKKYGYFEKGVFIVPNSYELLYNSKLVANGGGQLSWSTDFNCNNSVGYWMISPNYRIFQNKKPKAIVRWCMKNFFDIVWEDLK